MDDEPKYLIYPITSTYVDPASAEGPAKLKSVTELVEALTLDAIKPCLTHRAGSYRDKCLEELRVYGRDTKDADPIFTTNGINTLLRHSYLSPASTTARAALKVLANALLLKPHTRQIVVDRGFAPYACRQLRKDDWEDEFLNSRILFFLTYGTTIELLELIDNHKLASHIVENVGRHAELLSRKPAARKDPHGDIALGETLRLMFNVTHYCMERIVCFTDALPHVIALLWKHNISEEVPLDNPVGSLVNSLVNLDFKAGKSRSALYPKSDITKVSARLVSLLDASLKAYSDQDLDSYVTPLITVINKTYDHAPDVVQQFLQRSLLPSVQDRRAVLGHGNSLTARLLKNSTNPLAPAVRDSISDLLFNLSGRDAKRFMENIGYGFASGFLFQNNMPIPASASEAFSKNDNTMDERLINPVTGQFLDDEVATDKPIMSPEEKTREAERLFVLFERLKGLNIVDVQNPVEQAVQQGRFEELANDDAGDSD